MVFHGGGGTGAFDNHGGHASFGPDPRSDFNMVNMVLLGFPKKSGIRQRTGTPSRNPMPKCLTSKSHPMSWSNEAETAPRPKKPGRGRPPRRGPLLPKPTDMLAKKRLRRTKIKLYQPSNFYLRITSVICRLYLAPECEVKVVVVEHLRDDSPSRSA